MAEDFPYPKFKGSILKQARIASGLSRYRLGKAARVSPMSVFNWETGKMVPSANNLIKMARCLDTNVLSFFEKDDDAEG